MAALTLHIAGKLWEQMRNAVSNGLPEEACGLLAGDDGQVVAVLPIQNALHSPVRFRLEARQQLQAFIWMESQSLELLGIYHSHPGGPDVPSETDIAEAYYPEAAHLIWSFRTGVWECRAFHIADGIASELRLLVD